MKPKFKNQKKIPKSSPFSFCLYYDLFFDEQSLSILSHPSIQIMRSGGGISSLNPYASSYVPLSKRDVGERSYVAENTSNTGPKNVWVRNPELSGQNQPDSKVSISSNAHVSEKMTAPTEKGLLHDDCAIDLDYLQIAFPDVSYESLVHVYLLNNGDLDISIEMLKELEPSPVEPLGNLPDTLDIGDASESSSSADGSSLKLKNLAIDAGSGS